MTKQALRLAASSGVAGLIIAAAAAYLLPFVPFRPTLLLALGVAIGVAGTRTAARWF